MAVCYWFAVAGSVANGRVLWAGIVVETCPSAVLCFLCQKKKEIGVNVSGAA